MPRVGSFVTATPANLCVSDTPGLFSVLASWPNEEKASHLVLNAHPACDDCL
jgi:hypothetical protein